MQEKEEEEEEIEKERKEGSFFQRYFKFSDCSCLELCGYAQEEGQFFPRCLRSVSMSYGLFVEGYSHALEPKAEFST